MFTKSQHIYRLFVEIVNIFVDKKKAPSSTRNGLIRGKRTFY